MSTTLLQTKLYIPRRRPSLIARPRLIDKLNQGLNKELTLISAPAGFGKTTLVIEWLQQCDLPAAWLALDEGDNDPVRFWAYVTAALNQIGIPHLEVDRSASPSANMAAMENVVTAVINEITTIPSDFLFVLDDYHLISEQAVHQALSFLIEHMPAQMHLVIATRSDLPFPVARLRARSALNELRQKDLQFTIEEAAFYFNQLTGLDLETAAIETLTRRTEGWISGLHMAAVSIERHKDPDRFIQAFAGSDRYIADYLIEEVLNQQPAHIQEFLLKTAVLQRFTTALCAAVTQSQPAKSQEILDELERANLFVTALDNRRQWYRYHRLFADLLLQILHQTYPGLALDLHRRASMWYEEQSLNAEAIEHAFACSDYERAAHLIEEVAESTFDRSETVTLQGWCAALPSEILQDHLCLLFYYTWSLMQSGRAQDKVEDYLEQLDRRGYIPGRVTALRALSIAFQDQIDQALEISRLALEQLAADDPFLRYAAAWNDNFSYRIDGDLSANMQALATSARKGSVAGNVTVAVGSLCQLARLLGRQGKLQQAKIQYEMALTQAVDGQKRPLPIAGLALIGLGELHLEWNELEEAANYLSKGIQLARQWRNLAALSGYVSLVRLQQAQRDEAGADDALAHMQEIALQSDATEVDDRFADFVQARLALMRGNLTAALGWAEAKGYDQIKVPIRLEQPGEPIISHLFKYEALVLARVWIANGHAHDARALLLQPLCAWLAGRERLDLEIEAAILCALSWHAEGELAKAYTCLEGALILAQPGNYIRIFVDEGQELQKLLNHLSPKDKKLAHYVRQLQAAYNLDSVPGPISAPQQPLIEPLSERELQILQLIANGLTNREVAQELILSLPTVKWHTSNIYGKLGVKNRTTAVAKARSLQIIPAL